MKKILLLIMMCALLPRTAEAQTPTDDTFTVSDLKYNSTLESYYFIVGLNAEKAYTAFNLEIYLPQGIQLNENQGVTIIKGSDPVYPYTNRYDEDLDDYVKVFTHSISYNYVGNKLLITCISSKNEEFRKNSGDLFRVYVTINESSIQKLFTPKPILEMKGLNLTKVIENVATKFVPADFACRPFTTGIPTSRTLPVNVSAENKIGTLILPFACDLPTGLKAYSCNGADDDLLTLTPASSIEACKPYIVYAENGYSGNLTGTATLPDADNVTDIFADGYLTGVLSGTTVNSGYILQNQGSGPMFYDAEGVTFSLPAGRCYLTPTASPVKAFAFNFDAATGVEKTFNSPLDLGRLNLQELSTFNLFDLSGRKIEAPARGIYIQGTRKVIVK